MWVKAKDIIGKSNGLFIDKCKKIEYEDGFISISEKEEYIITTLINSETKNLVIFNNIESARKVMKDFEQAIKNNENFFEIKEK